MASAYLVAPVVSAGGGNATLDAEATVYQNQPGFNGGGDTQVCVGNNGASGTARRALVRYTLPEIPVGAEITHVNLTLRQVRVRSNGLGPVSATVSIHRVLEPWEEGGGSGPGNGPCGGGSDTAGVDWDSMPGIESLPSAQFGFSASAPQQLMVMDDDASTGQLMEDVISWTSGAANHGWLLKINSEVMADTARVVEPGALVVFWDDPPELAVTGNARPVAAGDDTPSGINGTYFGAIPPATGFRDQIFRITNAGEQDLILDSTTPVMLAGSPEFMLIADPATTLAPASHTDFTIRFTPTLEGMHEASVSISSNDPGNDPYVFTISGFGGVEDETCVVLAVGSRRLPLCW